MCDQMKRIVAQVISKTELMPEIYLLWLHVPEIAGTAQPGQFVMVRCGEGNDPLLRRPLSIHRTAGGEQIALLFNVVGRGTWLLSQFEESDLIDLVGPLGRGYSLQPDSTSFLLVAGGIGVSPLVFLADELLKQSKVVSMILGATSAGLLYPRSLLPPSLQLEVVTEDGTEGSKGVVTDLIADFIGRADQVFACGPVSMYRSMLACDCVQGKAVQVSLEVMMGCGVGACYGCTIKTRRGLKQVCKDGPVFDLNDVAFEEGGDIKW